MPWAESGPNDRLLLKRHECRAPFVESCATEKFVPASLAVRGQGKNAAKSFRTGNNVRS